MIFSVAAWIRIAVREDQKNPRARSAHREAEGEEGRRPAPLQALGSSLGSGSPLPGPPESGAPADPTRPITRGELSFETPKESLEDLAELRLSEAQRFIVEALLSDRAARLRDVAEALAREVVDPTYGRRTSSERARKINSEFKDALRSMLLPDQRERLEGLLKSGRWGRYVIPLPGGGVENLLENVAKGR